MWRCSIGRGVMDNTNTPACCLLQEKPTHRGCCRGAAAGAALVEAAVNTTSALCFLLLTITLFHLASSLPLCWWVSSKWPEVYSTSLLRYWGQQMKSTEEPLCWQEGIPGDHLIPFWGQRWGPTTRGGSSLCLAANRNTLNQIIHLADATVQKIILRQVRGCVWLSWGQRNAQHTQFVGCRGQQRTAQGSSFLLTDHPDDWGNRWTTRALSRRGMQGLEVKLFSLRKSTKPATGDFVWSGCCYDGSTHRQMSGWACDMKAACCG